MNYYWFVAGVLATLSLIVLLTPWLRRLSWFAAVPALGWPAAGGALVVLAAVFAAPHWLHAPPPKPMAGAGGFGDAVKALNGLSKPASANTAAAPQPDAGAKGNAGSMDAAISSLEARLAKGGGTPDDWELLAKSFEFLGRPEDAAKARAHQIPPPGGEAGAATAPSTAGVKVTGEVGIAPGLAGKAAAGDTLFIVAKAAEGGGPPLAVFRTTVGAWPVKFTLDDSLSMVPGRNISSAGKVRVEARISHSGQALPASGDLQGTAGVVDPAQPKPVQITIDKAIP